MLSDHRIQKLAQLFTCVTADPREKDVDRRSFQHKATRYVPEVVFVDVRRGKEEVLMRLEDRSVDGTIEVMKKVLNKHGR